MQLVILDQLSALTLSLASLGALVALLSISDGQPVSTWAGLSPSAIVSILAGTSRASLAFVVSTCLSQGKWNWAGRFVGPLIDFDRFDAASRGAWGSIRLLRSMIRHPHWASVGAFTVIVLLAYEPFIQAVLTLKDVSVVLDNTNYNQLSAIELDSNRPSEAGPVIGRSSILDAGYWNVNPGAPARQIPFPGPDGKEMFFRPDDRLSTPEDMGLTGSVWNGFSSFVTPRNLWPAFSCASGNCSWAPFTSLAICSRCISLSKHAVRTSGNYTFPAGYGVPGGWQLRKNETLPEVSSKDLFAHLNVIQREPIAWTRHEIPELGLSLTNYDGKRKCGSGDVRCPDTYLSVTFTTNPGRTINFSNSSTLVLAIQFLQADKRWRENETTWQDTQVTTQECGLYFCVNEYETSLEQGVLKEQVVNSWTEKTSNSHNPPSPSDIEYLQYLNNTLDLFPYYVNLTDLQLFVPDEHNKSLAKDTFNITQPSIVLLFDNIRKGLEGFDGRGSTRWNGTTSFIYPSFGLSLPPAMVFGLGEAGNVSASVKKVELSLTKWMRDRGLASSPVYGEATVMMVINRVRWEFLVFPAVVHLLGVLFAVVSIWETNSLKRPAWKSSMLAALSHAPDGELRERLREAATPDDIQEVGRKAKVMMECQDGRSRLVSKEEIE
ncbi:uncharacterized protein NECHADRAFT_94612 [Fusarium vanettenii 77-13-4]|uniref:Uncharacterized protein n=1 Tax=Fusarium vanettenii (strain ATCC MYA-4622 / CBS 123669 / FGSC 9596 / NRRL 45880 / 77-13-4) TaxID=660122 RepID=C7ZA12_FUSV7|nr:uncharacterized protein NECHADRAFT_94612 [Fusarium vanettenii 77-13-4]EEU39192.1 hypothetical protein NECHADRAFT_94612 [Fusarium vanettenii 77-13-4]